MPRPRWIAVLIALIAVVWVLRSTVFRAPPVAVEVAIAGRGIVLDTVSNSRAATVRSRLRARVGAETGGRVVALPQRAGMRVAAGDVLVELDAATARRRLALAREDLAAARARFEAADAAAALAASERSRVESLGNAGLVATEQLDTARSAADRTRAEAAAARAQIERAAAAVRLTEQEIENLRVRAPFDGVVAEVLTELGESVVPGAPLIEILDPDALYVSAEIDEVDIGRVQVGLAVLIELDPFPGVEFHGTVTRVAPYVSDLLEQNR
ncbi:MAG: efflux RND transporter periplasmic adaptor subunit, partial [Candidatus Eiseniibacteriota bacterium]